MVGFFGQEACGILAPWPGVETTPPVLEGEVLINHWTTREAPLPLFCKDTCDGISDSHDNPEETP